MIVDGATVTYDPDATPGSYGDIPIPEYFKDGKNHLWVKFYDGTQADPDPYMVEHFGSDPGLSVQRRQ